ncbi:SANT and BTB domain regulator of class switch recombination [Octopus bimaculoides]|nr:SANT and BTB domain regulator of class switch recombination [Octopus bimaculoides]
MRLFFTILVHSWSFTNYKCFSFSWSQKSKIEQKKEADMYTAASTTTSTIASTNTNTNSTTVVSSTTATATTVANIDPQSFTGITLDLILKRFMECEDFLTSDHKDWNTISRMVPHTTPLQCAHRFEELLIKDKHMNPNNYPSEGLNHQQLPPQEIQGSSIDPLLTKKAPIGHPKFKGFKDKEHHTEKPTFIPEDITEKVSMMIIRVYDEAKDVEQHFQCPRNILIEEMKYFKEYLSADPQQLREDFDISVHCDIQIFDWLIRYAKRNLPNAEPVLGIDSNNIISLLISSDFLKMDSLVQKCISYIHDNLSDILRAPSNMNCINDKLVTRIAELFNHNEIEEIKDKKDKFKSKLFSKKIERLFDSSPNLKPNPDSPGSGVYLFRCCHCQKILLPKYAQRIRCAPSRLSVNEIGELVYNHDTDMTFDINEFILALKSQMVTWRNVYWKLWGLVNYLHCTWCNEMFPCAHFGHCPYHPEEPQFQTAAGRDGETVSSKLVSPIGHYPCCNQTVCRFDPANLNLGCQARDHIVKPLVNKENSTKDTPEETCNLFKDLIAHRDIIGIPYNNTNDFYLSQDQSADKDSSNHNSSSSYSKQWRGGSHLIWRAHNTARMKTDSKVSVEHAALCTTQPRCSKTGSWVLAKIGNLVSWELAKIGNLLSWVVAKIGNLLSWVVAKIGNLLSWELAELGSCQN